MKDIDWENEIENISIRLYRYFQHKGATPPVASDLTQDTLIRILQKCEKYDPQLGSPQSFSLGIARFIWFEHYREIRKNENLIDDFNLDDLIDDSNLELIMETKDQIQKLKIILNTLPTQLKDIMYFYFDEELTTREIANLLGQSEGTIKSHIHRTKDKIKQIFERNYL
jgi:RNA polymerase sigma factor (sigma-70 family)